jgi:hypothetical protein
MYTEQMTQGVVVAGTPVHSQSIAVGNANTGGVDLALFRRALFVLDVGAVGTGNITAQLQESSDNVSFTNVATAGTWATTAIAAANKVATLEIRAGQLSAGKRYVRCLLTVATAAVQAACLPLGGEADHKPGNLSNDASVAQQIVNN